MKHHHTTYEIEPFAKAVNDYLQKNGLQLTPAGLIRACYVVGGHYLAQAKTRLFDEDVVMSPTGPTIPALEKSMSGYGTGPIPMGQYVLDIDSVVSRTMMGKIRPQLDSIVAEGESFIDSAIDDNSGMFSDFIKRTAIGDVVLDSLIGGHFTYFIVRRKKPVSVRKTEHERAKIRIGE